MKMKNKLGLPSDYKIKGCNEEGSEVVRQFAISAQCVSARLDLDKSLTRPAEE